MGNLVDRSNVKLNEAIEQQISKWNGTLHGYCLKKAWEDGVEYKGVCKMANIDIDEYIITNKSSTLKSQKRYNKKFN